MEAKVIQFPRERIVNLNSQFDTVAVQKIEIPQIIEEPVKLSISFRAFQVIKKLYPIICLFIFLGAYFHI